MRTRFTAYLIALLVLASPSYSIGGDAAVTLTSNAPHAGMPAETGIVFQTGSPRIIATAKAASTTKTKVTFTWYAPDGTVRSSTVKLAFPSRGATAVETFDSIDNPETPGWWKLEVTAGDNTLRTPFLLTDDETAFRFYGDDRGGKLSVLETLDPSYEGYMDILRLAYLDKDYDIRSAAVDAASRIGTAQTAGFIASAVSDGSYVVRAAVARAAVSVSADARQKLLETLASDTKPFVRLALARSLGGDENRAGGHQSIALLADLIHDSDWSTRDAALASLSGFEGDEATAALSNGFTVGVEEFRKAVLDAVASRRGAASTEIIAGRLSDPSAAIRADALRDLVDRGGDWPVDSARPLVDDPDPGTAMTAFKLLSGKDNETAKLALRSRHAAVRSAALALAIKRGGTKLPGILEAAVKDEDKAIRDEAVDALDGLGATGLSGLVIASGDADNGVRKKAVRAISDIGAPGAVDAMVKAEADEDPDIRLAALKYLVKQPYPGIYGLLAEAASDKSGDVRQAALDALVGMRGEQASESLGAFYETGDSVVRYRVMGALTGRDDNAAITVFERALDDPEPGIRVMAVRSLAENGHGADAARLALDPDKDIKRAAMDAISASPEAGMLPVLKQLLADPDTGIRMKALGALGSIDGAEAGGAISLALQDREIVVRELAVRLLLERDDEGAATGLAVLLDDRDGKTRRKAADALVKVKGENADAVLERVLATGGPNARLLALDVLKRRGSALLPDAAATALSDNTPEVREAALDTARSLDEKAREKVYKAAAGSVYPDIRLAGITGLGAMSGGAVETIVQALTDDDARVRLAAVDALSARHAPELEVHLATLVTDPDAAVATAAFKAAGSDKFADRTGVLLKAASGGHKKIARDAVDRLIDSPDASALSVYEEYFESGYRRREILSAACSIKGDDASRYIGGMYRSCRPGDPLRLQTVECLAGRGDAALSVLADALKDGSAEVRLAAVRSIAGLKVSGSRCDALGAAVNDPDRVVRSGTLVALSEIDEPCAAAYMLPYLDDKELRDEALADLENAVSQQDVQGLAARIRDVRDPAARAGFVRLLAAKGLDYEALYGLLDDTAAQVRVEAVAGLKGRGGPAGAYGLFIAGTSKDAATARAAIDALSGMPLDIVEAGIVMHFERGTLDNAMLGLAGSVVRDGDALVRIEGRIPESDAAGLRAFMAPLIQRHAPQDASAMLDGLKTSDARLRSDILVGIAALGPAESGAAFVAALSRYPGMAPEIITAASAHGLQVPVAEAALGLGDPSVRVSAIAGLKTGPCPEMEGVISKALGDTDVSVRLAAARKAAGSGCSSALVSAAADSAPSVRKEAVEGLSRSGGPEPLTLLARLAEDRDEDVAGAAVAALDRKGSGVTPGVWAGLAGPEHPKSTRLNALGVIVGRKDTQYIPVLASVLKDSDRKIAELGVSGLAALGSAAADEVNRLITDPAARDNALRAAGQIADPSSEGPILSVMPGLTDGSLYAAVDALGRLGGEASVGPLKGVYEKGDVRLRLAVIKAVSGLRLTAVPPELTGLLAGAMADPDESIRFYAARAAGSIGDAALADTLKARLAVESSDLVSSEIRRSLEKLSTVGAAK